MRARRRAVLFYLIWLAVVWGHSLMPGDLSSYESSRFVFLVRPFFEILGVTDEQVMTFWIRKGAHFTEYAILAALGWNMCRTCLPTTRIAKGIACVLLVAAPCLDETIQLFVDGRAGSVRDVAIDICGGLTGLALTWVVHRVRMKAREP